MEKPGVYIIHSKRWNQYYIGSTGKVHKRLIEHNKGKVPSTSGGKPWVLKTFLPCLNIKSARESELRLKKYKRRDVVEKVVRSEIFPWDLGK